LGEFHLCGGWCGRGRPGEAAAGLGRGAPPSPVAITPWTPTRRGQGRTPRMRARSGLPWPPSGGDASACGLCGCRSVWMTG